MKSLRIIAVLIACTVQSVFSQAPIFWEEGVKVLTDGNYKTEMKKYNYMLVNFYSPKCPKC